MRVPKLIDAVELDYDDPEPVHQWIAHIEDGFVLKAFNIHLEKQILAAIGQGRVYPIVHR